MPTISQLPATTQVTAADELPLSQGGAARSVSVGTLLAGVQPAIEAPSGTLLGRISLGAGGPEAVSVGTGLQIASDVLVATGADHTDFTVQGTLVLTDQAVLNSSGTPKLLQLSELRGLFSAGTNISIDTLGTISTTLTAGSSTSSASYSITNLPSVTAMAGSDLVGISQGGVDHTITYANLIDGQTIDQAQPAGAAADTDTLWVDQGGSTMLRQTLSAVWGWMITKLPTYQLPSTEITINTTLNMALHNGRVLICSQPIILSPPTGGVGNGFFCDVINLSAGSVTLGNGIVTSSGTAVLPAGQAARLNSVTYSAGTLIYAGIVGSNAGALVPGQVSGLAVTAVTANSVTLSWSAPTPSASTYGVQYRITGTTSWSSAPSSSAAGCTVSGLLAGSSYDFMISGVNSAGSGAPSTVLTTTTASGLTAPGQVLGLAAGSPTASSISLNWSAPTSGGAPSSYTVQYRVSGTPAWNTAVSGLGTTTFVMTGLAATTSYDMQVSAINATGAGLASQAVTASTLAGAGSVSSITWNMVPSGSYTHGSGAIGINAHISPATAPVQFGFSTSGSVPPSSWTVASLVNSDLWGAYVPTPASAGTWYAWAEGVDGSTPTVYPTGFVVT